MSVHVLLILLSSLAKEKKPEACRAFNLFCNKLNKLNNTGAQMLDSIYHMILKILKNCIFGVKMSRFSLILHNLIMDVLRSQKICKPLVVCRFYYMALYHF